MLINIGQSVVCGVFDCFSVKSSFNSLNEEPVIKRRPKSKRLINQTQSSKQPDKNTGKRKHKYTLYKNHIIY